MSQHWIKLSLFAFILLCSVNTQAAEQLYSHQPTVTPELAIAGKYAVGVRTLTARNPRQLSATDFKTLEERVLTLEVWYPAKVSNKSSLTSYKNVTRSHQEFEIQASAYRQAPPVEGDSFPLIILSHGYTGYRTIMFYLGEHLASHGYVVVGIDHTDSTNAEIDFATAPGAGFLSTLRNRARDQQFILDYFTNRDSVIGNITNSDKAAVIGYSMGGYGAINTIGGCYQFTAAKLQIIGIPEGLSESLLPALNDCSAGREITDPRWQAMIAFSPWGGELDLHSTASLKSIKVPSLYVSGSLDDISGFESGVKSLFKKSQAADTFLMVYENARHNVAAHPAPQISHQNDLDIGHHYEPSWDIESLNRINQHMSLAFLDCYVKQQRNACEYLPARQDIAQKKMPSGKMNDAWPGFKERWGTGVSFHKK